MLFCGKNTVLHDNVNFFLFSNSINGFERRIVSKNRKNRINFNCNSYSCLLIPRILEHRACVSLLCFNVDFQWELEMVCFSKFKIEFIKKSLPNSAYKGSHHLTIQDIVLHVLDMTQRFKALFQYQQPYKSNIGFIPKRTLQYRHDIGDMTKGQLGLKCSSPVNSINDKTCSNG